MMKTNIELVKYVENALKENWGYCLGTFGQVLTPTLLTQKMSQGSGVGTYNTKHKVYLNSYVNKRVSDCYGLVKGFLWTDVNRQVKYVASQDQNQEGAFSRAKEKGTLSTMPEVAGLILWMKGHAGIYIGNGEFIECSGAPVGMRKGKIQGGKIVSGSKFTHWFKDTNIIYEDKSFINLDLLGKKVKLEGYFEKGINYAKIGDKKIPIRTVLESLGLTVTGKGNEVVAK